MKIFFFSAISVGRELHTYLPLLNKILLKRYIISFYYENSKGYPFSSFNLFLGNIINYFKPLIEIR